jgi:hypothetical protein
MRFLEVVREENIAAAVRLERRGDINMRESEAGSPFQVWPPIR